MTTPRYSSVHHIDLLPGLRALSIMSATPECKCCGMSEIPNAMGHSVCNKCIDPEGIQWRAFLILQALRAFIAWKCVERADGGRKVLISGRWVCAFDECEKCRSYLNKWYVVGGSCIEWDVIRSEYNNYRKYYSFADIKTMMRKYNDAQKEVVIVGALFANACAKLGVSAPGKEFSIAAEKYDIVRKQHAMVYANLCMVDAEIMAASKGLPPPPPRSL